MKLAISIFMFFAGIACFIAFHNAESYLDAEGILHEPFALLPIGYLLTIIGGVSSLIFGLRKLKSRK